MIIICSSCNSSPLSGSFCLDLIISDSSGEKEITASVDIINDKIIALHHAGKMINLRDQDVYFHAVKHDEHGTFYFIDDFIYNGKMSKVEVDYIYRLDNEDECGY